MENENNNTPVSIETPASAPEIPPVESTSPSPEIPLTQPSAPPPEPSESAPTPASTPTQTSEPPTIQTQASTMVVTGLSGLLSRAKEKIQFRKRAKLEKIVVLAQSKGKIANDNVQKLLRCSDATASRYLAELVKQGRLKMISRRGAAVYQLT